MSVSYEDALRRATSAAIEAGRILRSEFHRVGGPRGHGGHCPADDEAEIAIRDQLTARFPDWSYLGEETGRIQGRDASHLWLVHPNDGTRSFLRGYRGTAVSIALLRGGLPVLGVVYAFCYPDHEGDLFAWAVDCGPILRNDRRIDIDLTHSKLNSDSLVLVSQGADKDSAANAKCVSPGRFRSIPSIAYRLALVAAGDGDAAVSLNGPRAWDYAGGHALVRGAGGTLVDQNGREMMYSAAGESFTTYCFGGAPNVVSELWRRPWRNVFDGPQEGRSRSPTFELSRLEPGHAVSDAGKLRRAQGCLLGQLAGDSLGSLVEFQSAAAILQRNPNGVSSLRDGGTWSTLAGQPTDDSEMALMLARSIVRDSGYDQEAAATAYLDWYDSKPFDIGNTTRQSLGSVADSDRRALSVAAAMKRSASASSEANGALMRASPLGVWGNCLPFDQAADYARADSALTHPNTVSQDACAVFVVAIAQAIREGLDAAEVYRRTVSWAEKAGLESSVLNALRAAADEPPEDYDHQQGWVLIALQNAFFRLTHSRGVEDGVVQTVMAGGDTDTNAAIAGALLGAVYGRADVPAQCIHMVLSCRPLDEFDNVHKSRPRSFWRVDAFELAERLLIANT